MKLSTDFKKQFLIRFISYLCILSGILVITLIAEPVLGEELKYRFKQLSGRESVLPKIVTSTSENGQTSGESSLGNISFTGAEVIVPKSTDFGIVIEKIDANALVVKDVDPSNSRQYMAALREGVAHAQGTVYPGQIGNIYLFSHSVGAPWDVVRFNAVFYLLNKLERGDRVVTFFEGKRYDYTVYDIVIVPPNQTHFLTDTYQDSVLTLQTCDPPGTTINRLIVRAKLSSKMGN